MTYAKYPPVATKSPTDISPVITRTKPITLSSTYGMAPDIPKGIKRLFQVSKYSFCASSASSHTASNFWISSFSLERARTRRIPTIFSCAHLEILAEQSLMRRMGERISFPARRESIIINGAIIYPASSDHGLIKAIITLPKIIAVVFSKA